MLLNLCSCRKKGRGWPTAATTGGKCPPDVRLLGLTLTHARVCSESTCRTAQSDSSKQVSLPGTCHPICTCHGGNVLWPSLNLLNGHAPSSGPNCVPQAPGQGQSPVLCLGLRVRQAANSARERGSWVCMCVHVPVCASGRVTHSANLGAGESLNGPQAPPHMMLQSRGRCYQQLHGPGTHSLLTTEAASAAPNTTL